MIAQDYQVVHSFGDSITAGLIATDEAHSYINVLGQMMGWSIINHAHSGDQAADQVDLVYKQPVIAGSIATYMLGTNDFGRYKQQFTTFQATHQEQLAYLAIPDSAKLMPGFASSPITYTGFWKKSPFYPSGVGIYSTTGNDSASFLLTGETLVISALWIDYSSASYRLSVDGAQVPLIFTTQPPAPILTLHNRTFAPHLIIIPNLKNTVHTVVLTVRSADQFDPVVFNWAAGLSTQPHSANYPKVFVGNITFQAGFYYAQQQNDPALMIAYNQQIAGNVWFLDAMGLNVYLADSFAGFDSATLLGPDGLHPNDDGHVAIADAFKSAITRAM